jgi:hypothetical protein
MQTFAYATKSTVKAEGGPIMHTVEEPDVPSTTVVTMLDVTEIDVLMQVRDDLDHNDHRLAFVAETAEGASLRVIIASDVNLLPRLAEVVKAECDSYEDE